MFSALIARNLRQKKYFNRNIIRYKYLSTQIAQKQETSDVEKIKEYEDISKITRRNKNKKPQKPPFVKNLFLGVFDNDVLTFPQLSSKEEVQNLEKQVDKIKELFTQPELNDRSTKILKTQRNQFSKNKLFGLQASQLIGGRDFTLTESFRMFEEISKNSSQIGYICNEQLGIQCLLKNGNNQQKNKYLEKLLSGEILSSFCLRENAAMTSNQLQTSAVLSNDKKTWVSKNFKTLIYTRFLFKSAVEN